MTSTSSNRGKQGRLSQVCPCRVHQTIAVNTLFLWGGQHERPGSCGASGAPAPQNVFFGLFELASNRVRREESHSR